MRKRIAFVAVLLVMTLCAACALGAGVTLRVFTPFADMDAAAQSYMDMITAWEEETGNVVEDYSGLMDDAWMETMLSMVRAGAADVVVLPMGTGLTQEELVTVDELLAVTDNLGVRRFDALTEEDGSVLLSPLRVNWEALYVNTDVLEASGLSVPGTYEELLAVCSALAGKGVTPIANALCEWAEIVLDCAALASTPAEQFGTQASLDGARQMVAALCAVGAFGKDAFNATDADTAAAFLAGEAAMRIDGAALAQEVPGERRDSVIVIPMPRPAGQTQQVLAGTVSCGIAITRACWQDDARCDAAVTLVRALLGGENYRSLAVGVDGKLGESIVTMLSGAIGCAGILYDAVETDFDAWQESVISSLMTK